MKNYMISAICITGCLFGYAQSKNFIDQPYLETTAKVDSLVKPDRIYLSILIQENLCKFVKRGLEHFDVAK